MQHRIVAPAASAALLALSLAPGLAAQNGTLAGVVTNETGAAVAQAQISVLGSPSATGTLSDDQGRYRISLAPGTYDLLVQHVAHSDQRISNVSVSTGQTTARDVQMVTTATALAGGALVVTVDRRQVGDGGRVVESVATTDLVSSLEISERPTPNLADHLRETPGVDIITQGLQSTNVVVRGFNNIFSGALHMLSDYRLAGVPSLRVNLMHFIPTVDEDVERMEVVLGPASALYGPNTANGVVHIISKSPLREQGTTVTLGSGAKGQDHPSAFQGSFRSAFLLDDDFGVKFSGGYLNGEEWRFVDPVEEAGRVEAQNSPATCQADKVVRGLDPDEAQTACGRIGVRDFDVERWSFEGRADWRFADDGEIVGTYGRNTSSGIELTGLGAGQTGEWVSEFYQMRLDKGRLFAQTYLNSSDAGDSFLLRDGTVLVDQSSLFVAQLQHGFDAWDGRQDFTYGVDYFGTRPDSEGSIYGSYEDDDEMDEWGVYVQSSTAISPKVDLIGALRMDSHSVLPDNVWSPRAALVFKPDENHGIRFSYNRAFSTPTALNFFLDIPGGIAPGALGGLGYSTRAYGSGRDGWSVQASDGTLRGMRSPFAPPGLGGPQQLLPADVPTMWQLLVGVLQAQGAIDGPTAAGLAMMNPQNSDIARLALNPLSGQVTPVASLTLPDMEPTRESHTETFEIGWTGTGLFDNRVAIAADVYFARKNDFVSPLLVQTPLLLLNEEDLRDFLTPAVGPSNAAALAAAGSQIPLGVVSSESSGARGAELILSYRNVGDIDMWGGDVSIQAFLTDRWTLTGSYSYVSDDEFAIDGGAPITLNAPKNKGSLGLAYRDLSNGLTASSRVRFTSAFPASSAGFVGDVEGHGIVDVTAGYEIPDTRATLRLSVSNVFDEEYQSFVGVPKIGRFTMLSVRYELF